MEISKSGTAVFVGLMMMTAGFVLTLAGWFAPPITDTVLRVRMAGPVTLLLGFVLLVFSYILCAIEQQKCSECCYQFIRAREKEHDIRSCDMMTSPSDMQIDHVITENHVMSPQRHSIPHQIQILQQHLAQLQMNQEALLHPGLNYVYNPLIAAYNFHPNVAPRQDTQNSNGHVNNNNQPMSNHDQMEALISKNSHIPFIDDPSSDSSGQTGSENKTDNGFDPTMDIYPPQRGHIVKIPKTKKGCKHKNSKHKSSLKDIEFSSVIKNSNAQDCETEIWPKRRQSKKELISGLNVHSKNSATDGNGPLHVTDYYSQAQDTRDKNSDNISRRDELQGMMPNRVPTSERLSLCVPITPDSDGELTDKLEGLSTNSSFTSQTSPQTNGRTSRNSSTGHVIVNMGTGTSSCWGDTNVDSNKENCDSNENSQLLPKELLLQTKSHNYSKNIVDFAAKSRSLKVMPASEYVHRNTAVTKKDTRHHQHHPNVMSLDLVSHLQVASPSNMQKPITSVKPLPKDQSSPQSPNVLPSTKSHKLPIARARIIEKPEGPYTEMADSTV